MRTLSRLQNRSRLIRIAFILKSLKIGQDRVKFLKSISLMSFVLKTFEKLLDGCMRDGVLLYCPLHQYQHAYQAIKLAEDGVLFHLLAHLVVIIATFHTFWTKCFFFGITSVWACSKIIGKCCSSFCFDHVMFVPIRSGYFWFIYVL